jgi:hypothetical protein
MLNLAHRWAQHTLASRIMGGRVVKRLLGFAVVLFTIIACVSGAEAIDIYSAEVKNGGVFVQGDKAVAYSTITWEGQSIAAANRYGGFRFVGVVPQSCIGTLSDGASTIQVVVVDCTPGILPTAIVDGGLVIGAIPGG